MIEAYKIGTTFTIMGDAKQNLMAIGESAKKSGASIKQLTTYFNALNKQLVQATTIFKRYDSALMSVNKNFEPLKTSLLNVNASMTKLGHETNHVKGSLRGVNESFTNFNRKTDTAINRTETLVNQSRRLTQSLMAVSASASRAADSVGAVSATSSIRSARGVGGTTSGAEGGFLAGAFGGLPGMAAIAGAYMAVQGVKKGYNASKNYQQIMAQISMQNIPGITDAKVNNFVNNNPVTGVSKLDMLQKFQDALVVTKNANEAAGLAPYIAKISYGNKSIYGGTAQQLNDSQFYSMIKSAELLTGSMDPKVLIPVINEMVKLNSATSGQVQPSQILQLNTKSRGTLKGADPRLLYELEPIIQEMGQKGAGGGGGGGGAQVGTAVRAFYNHIEAGRITTAAALQLQKLGLVKDGYAEFNKIGMIKRIKPGGIKGQQQLHDNFVEWYWNVFLKAAYAHGITDPNKIKQLNATIFTNTDLGLVNLLTQQEQKIKTTAAFNAKAAGTNQLVTKAGSTAKGQEEQFHQAVQNLAQAFGDMTRPAVLSGMSFLTRFLNTTTYALGGLSLWGDIISAPFKFGAKVAAALPTPYSATKTLYDAANGALHNMHAQPAQINIHIGGDLVSSAFLKNINQNHNVILDSATAGHNPSGYATPTTWSGN